jgi:spore maturation protein A
MLNYIWAGLIVFSLVFALAHDTRDLVTDAYRSGQPVEVTVAFPDGYQPGERRQPVVVTIDPVYFQEFFQSDEVPAESYEGTLVQVEEGRELRFAQNVGLPHPLETVREVTSPRDNDLRGPVGPLTFVEDDTLATTTVRFAPVRFVKMQAITSAAFDFAETAVTLALGLIGVLALWLGLLQIADKSGLLYALVRFTQPLIRPLFPEIPKGHPAFGMIVLNLTANMLGLGNAATPLGIKAMEELQKLNPTSDTATNSMVMLLALNTASVQIVPPVLLVAIMGLQINDLILAIIAVTFISAVVAITATKLLGRLKGYRATDPMVTGPTDTDRDTDTTAAN